ncbi:hypothetical protein NK718_13320 [Alsobacter sp. SYSU M60028]|uniref:Glutamine amidotransferase n=1 Tax=Alsobacter ponti TaxID=2962936 RepID=A0ABT1LFJ8_9HYPH|nr:hypothetical protein [Alsobacter ponti]MCP8939500.1 hypothetical protein [Alsobacter ponti]
MFTIEIGGKPVAVVDATEAGTRELLEQEDFQEDLASLTSSGQPLWDGNAALTIRPSTEDEIAEFEDSAFDDEDDEDEDTEEVEGDEDVSTVYFLVPLDDDEDEED